jgi:hypothetical protein
MEDSSISTHGIFLRYTEGSLYPKDSLYIYPSALPSVSIILLFSPAVIVIEEVANRALRLAVVERITLADAVT